jgi:hypothetical protein
MTSQEPVNIQRLVRQNDVYAKAETYARTVTVGNLVAGWHEKDAQASRASGARTTSSPATTLTQKGASISNIGSGPLAQEAALEARAAKQQRAARMQELYSREALAFDAELQQRGLSLHKDRP